MSNELEPMDNPYDDYCYECMSYGDDYEFDKTGELVKTCDTCPFNDLVKEEQ